MREHSGAHRAGSTRRRGGNGLAHQRVRAAGSDHGVQHQALHVAGVGARVVDRHLGPVRHADDRQLAPAQSGAHGVDVLHRVTRLVVVAPGAQALRAGGDLRARASASVSSTSGQRSSPEAPVPRWSNSSRSWSCSTLPSGDTRGSPRNGASPVTPSPGPPARNSTVPAGTPGGPDQAHGQRDLPRHRPGAVHRDAEASALNPDVGAAGTQGQRLGGGGLGGYPGQTDGRRQPQQPGDRQPEGVEKAIGHAAADTIAWPGRSRQLHHPISSAIPTANPNATTSQRSTRSSRRRASPTPAWPPSRRASARLTGRGGWPLEGAPRRRSYATRWALAACSVFCAAEKRPAGSAALCPSLRSACR